MASEPKLPCPACGKPLIPPDGRGLLGADGEFIEHKLGCSCGRCEWTWLETSFPEDFETCACGVTSCVKVDDDRAYALEVGS